MTYHLYCCTYPPLDWIFAFFTVDELKDRIRRYAKDDFGYTLPDNEELINRIDLLLSEAEQAAKARHWDGVYRDQPLIFAIPAGEGINVLKGKYTPIGTALFGIIIKQDNDGDTFIYSPVELKHLEIQ